MLEEVEDDGEAAADDGDGGFGGHEDDEAYAVVWKIGLLAVCL